MTPVHQQPLAIALLGVLLLMGCNRQAADEAVPAASVLTPAIHTVAGAPPSPAPAGTAANGSRQAERVAGFQPPFPERVNPFQRPRLPEQTQPTARQAPSSTEIALKGFVNVKGSRALLAANGKFAAVAEGEQWAGIEVVDITPPEVTLQRGRHRWSVSLFHGPQ